MSTGWLPRGFGRIGFLALVLAGALLAWQRLRDAPPPRHADVADPVIGRTLALGLTTLLRGSDRTSAPVSGTLPLVSPPGQPHLVNLFASWCIPCRIEAPVLARLAGRGIRIDGVAVGDRPVAVTRFLARSGNPFASVRLDPLGRVQAALGVAGLPETYVVDGRSVITYRHRGALSPDDVSRLTERLH